MAKNAYQILGEIGRIDARIDVKLAEVQRLWDKATKVTAVLNAVKVVSSASGGGMSEAVERIADLEQEINAEIDRFVDYKRKVQTVLDKMENPDYVRVVYKRYFEQKPWEAIAEEMNMSARHVQRYHTQALPVFLGLWEQVEDSDAT